MVFILIQTYGQDAANPAHRFNRGRSWSRTSQYDCEGSLRLHHVHGPSYTLDLSQYAVFFFIGDVLNEN